MYSHWAASWRSGLAVGAVLLVVGLVQIGPILAEAPGRQGSIVMSVLLGVAVLTLIVSASIRVGRNLSGRDAATVREIVATTAAYLAILGLLYMVWPMRVLLSLAGFMCLFLILPAAVAYGMARLLGTDEGGGLRP